MPVRKTESRIPGGFNLANASELGQAAISADQKYAMVAYFSEPIRMDLKVPFWNKYVAFVNTNQVISSNIGYLWTIEFKNGSTSLKTYESISNKPMIRMDAEKIGAMTFISAATQCIVRVEFTGTGAATNPSVTLSQNIIGTRQDLELFINTPISQMSPYAFKGNEYSTRLIGNKFRDYIDNSSIIFNLNTKIPKELLTAIIYVKSEQTFWEVYENDFDILINQQVPKYAFDPNATVKIGPCGVKPYSLAMFLPKVGISNAPVYLPYKKTDDIYTEKSAFNDYFSLVSENDRIDIYNLLRFPKSNLKMCSLLLDGIKGKHSQWADLSAIEVKKNTDCMKALITELSIGSQGDIIPKPYFNSGAIANLPNSGYIKQILQAGASNTYNIDYKTIRIRVLDVRSGKPIKNAKVKRLIIKSTNASNTSIVFIGKEQKYPNGTVKVQEHKFSYSDPFKNISNTQKRAQIALEELGWYHSDDTNAVIGNNFTNETRRQYNNFWSQRFATSVPLLNEQSGGNPPDELCSLIIQEYQSYRETDDSGTLNLMIPASLLLNRKLEIEVGFFEFPICREMLKHEANANTVLSRDGNYPYESATEFKVFYIGNQSLDWSGANFGWQVYDKNNVKNSKLKVKETLIVKNDAANNQISSTLLSKYYDEIASPYHFVLFGMRWCQPVWDDFNDSILGVNQNTYVQDSAANNLHMHLVTKVSDLGGKDKYGGKGYGKIEKRAPPLWRSADNNEGDAHLGLDIFTRIGDNLFAIHYGKITTVNNPGSDAGKNVNLEWSGIGRTNVRYLHLFEWKVTNEEEVLPGQIIGIAGRSGNLGWNSSNPSHVHLNVGVIAPEGVSLRETPDNDNKIVIPNNKIPLVFPCKCQITSVLNLTESQILQKATSVSGISELSSDALINCSFNSAEYVKQCWAAAELKCPYINPNAQTNLQLQVQLRYLNERPPNGQRIESFKKDLNPIYFHPGEPDGDIGNAPTVLTTSIPQNAVIEILEKKHSDLLTKIKYQPGGQPAVITWIGSDLININDKKTTQSVTNLVSEASLISSTRMAIYQFKNYNNLLIYSNYASNFSMDAASWNLLNTITGLMS